MKFFPDYSRADRLVEIFRNINIDSKIDLFEERDIQYIVIKELSNYYNVKKLSIIVVGIALVSYLLSTRGENHWIYFKKYALKNYRYDVDEILLKFVENSPSMLRFKDKKIRRIHRYIDRVIPLLERDFNIYSRNLLSFRNMLAKNMETNLMGKTISFSIKMFYYVLKAYNILINIPMSIPIPVDYRVCIFSILSKVFKNNVDMNNVGLYARILRERYASEIRRIWNYICSRINVPPLRLDTFIWTTVKYIIDSKFDLNQAYISFSKNFSDTGLRLGFRKILSIGV